MKYLKKSLVAVLFLSALSQAENLPGRTRNLNVLKLHKYLNVELSGEKGSHNILRDLACNCDNPDFELSIAFKAKPFAFAQDLENFNEIIKNPLMRMAVMEQYEQAMTEQAQKNMQDFFSCNVKELLLSKDSEGKSALDRVKEKPDVMGCVLLKEAFENIQEILQEQEKQKNLEEEINKNER